jgi:hypothetical protein
MSALFYTPARWEGSSLSFTHFSPLGSRLSVFFQPNWLAFSSLSGCMRVQVALFAALPAAPMWANLA